MGRTIRPPGFRGTLRTDDAARAVYSEAAGIGRMLPLAVAVPGDEDDVASLVRWARATGTPLIPRGSGSSMAGGAIGSGVVCDLSRLDAIGAVEGPSRRIRVQPGAICADVDAAARARGLRFPVSPSSARFCTIGGMAATNAAGAHALRVGAMRSWVHALRCVFDDGTIAEVRRDEPPPRVEAIARFQAVREELRVADPAMVHAGVRKESSGYALAELARGGDLVDLLVGSEGTLALFVGVELNLTPLPGATSSVLGAFTRLEDAVSAAVRARETGAAACELLDRTFLEVAAEGARPLHLTPGADAVLLAEVEGGDVAEAHALAREVQRLFAETGATDVRVALDRAAEAELWELRHAASPILARLDPALKSMQFVEDGAVPPERLPEYVRGVREILAAAALRGVIFGHAGDAHVHVNPLVDVSRADWRERVDRVLAEVTALTARLGGTIAGEHGDGRLRAPLLASVWPPAAMQAFVCVKEAFDPAGILNPGAKVALAGQRPLGEIKYDPALPPLPAGARRALDLVETERAYGRFRLALLGG